MPNTVREHTAEIVVTDGELLVQFARDRDHAAFAQIVERHGRLVWMICRQVLGHHQDVEDAFQATFLILAERARSIRASDSAAAWLFGVAQRTALAARRKRARRREESLSDEPAAAHDSVGAIDNREMLYVLLQEIQNLPPRYQTPLVMRYLEGQSRRAIAEQTDSTVSQIQGRLARGRRILRSRFLRRGASLSLAAGAVAGDAAMAKSEVTPALIDATAETCLKVKTSGTVVGLPPTVLELVREGVNAMWVTFAAKCTAVVATIVLAGSVAWAAQQGGGKAAAGAGAAPVRITLLSADDKAGEGKQGTTKSLAAAADEKPGSSGSAAKFVADRLKYKVPVEIGETEFKDGGRIEIQEVWGTRPRIEVGGQYMVRGKYVLPPGQRGKLYFYETTNGEWGREPTSDVDLQTVNLDKETGEFTLVHGMMGPGNFHLYMASPDKYSHYFANVYFGTGEDVLRKKEAAPAPAPAATSAPAAAPSAPVSELEKRIEDSWDRFGAETDQKVELATRLELSQLEKASLQKKVEKLEGSLNELEMPAVDSIDKPIKENLANEVRQRLAETKAALAKQVGETAQLSAKLERVQMKLTQRQRELEEMTRMQMQRDLAPATSNYVPVPAASAIPVPADNWTLKVGDSVRIRVNANGSEILADSLTIEPMGTIALGPDDGRVKVEGMSVPEAEEAIKDKLSRYTNVTAQVTLPDKPAAVRTSPGSVPAATQPIRRDFAPSNATGSPYAAPVYAAPSSSFATVTDPTVRFVPVPDVQQPERFLEGLKGTIQHSQAELEKLKAENAQLKKQLEQKSTSAQVPK